MKVQNYPRRKLKMANILTVDEVLAEISANRKDNGALEIKQFSKKNFEKLLKAMLNDPNFSVKVAKIKNKEIDSIEDVEVSKGFRKFCKKVIEKSGIDKAESERILTSDFTFDNVDGLYEFMAAAIYLYIEKGNKFDFLTTPDFKGSLYIKEIDSVEETKEAFNPKTRESLGVFTTKKKKYKSIATKSGCPAWCKSRIKK